MNENQCKECGGYLTKTFAPFKNFIYFETCQPNMKIEISEYLRTLPRSGGFSGGSGKQKGEL